MWVYDNDTVSDTFIVDLTKDRDVQDNLPCNFLSVRNDSSLVAFVYLDNKRVGAVQAYSSDPFIGKNFEIIMIKQPDGNNFAIGDLFLQVGKNEQMSSTPYNPSWDLMEENIDVYASGCDARLSLSTTKMSIDGIKYLVNMSNGYIVQRRLSIQGSASLGNYEITFDPDTILSGGVPINGEVLDTKMYKKTIVNEEFDYSITNATIKGWMIDYITKIGDISDDYTVIVGGTQPPKSYDNNMITYGNYTGNADKTLFELSFSSRHISDFYLYLSTSMSVSSGSIYVYVQLKISGVWTTIITYSQSTNGIKFEHESTGWDDVTGIKFYLNEVGTGWINHFKVYDMSFFE